jgi:6-phosphogluconolactonase
VWVHCPRASNGPLPRRSNLVGYVRWDDGTHGLIDSSLSDNHSNSFTGRTNFVAASVVNFGGTARTTAFVSTTQLTAAIPATAIGSAGTAAVAVTNQAPGGGTSNAVNFTITSGTTPVPTINALDPSCAPIGGRALTLFVNGSNFVASSVVRWNGSDRPTAVRSTNGTLLTAQIPASDIAASGTAAVTVFNPAPGGGSSNTSTFTITTGGVDPQSIAVDPTGKFAYVANTGCPSAFAGSVSMYTINPTSGALASIATIQAPCAPPPSPGSCAPYSVAVDPSGKFAYVANEGGFAPTSISMYAINATTGALTATDLIAAEGRAVSVTVHPSGKFAYVADVSNGFPGENNNLSMYNINATTGALTSIGTIATELSPSSIAIDPSGKFAYVTNFGSNGVSMYTINGTIGTLMSIGPIAVGASPTSVAVDPSGKFAYVTNSGSNNVSMFTVNATTGVLITSTGTIAAELSPSSIAIHPSGKFAYVTNSGSNSVSMYSIDAATGGLTLIGTIGT